MLYKLVSVDNLKTVCLFLWTMFYIALFVTLLRLTFLLLNKSDTRIYLNLNCQLFCHEKHLNEVININRIMQVININQIMQVININQIMQVININQIMQVITFQF